MNKHSVVCLASLFLATSPHALLAAEYSGLPIDYKSFPNEVRAAIPNDITIPLFKLRLKQGGTVTLDGNETTIGPINPSAKSIAFMALDRLELKRGAKIVTNGNALVIFVNTLASEDGEIISFKPPADRASDAAPATGQGGSGFPGAGGISGGLVSIHVIEGIEGRLKVNLLGQSGGNGSDGIAGGPGAVGSRGEDAQDGPGGWLTPGWCKRGGSDGSGGGKGFSGGAGGPGGSAGDGGYFELINVGASPIPGANYTFSAIAGRSGRNGQGGAGGPGGRGGDGGHGSTWCGGGRGGPTGPTGDAGLTIQTPPQAGSNGQIIAKNLDLEIVVRSATSQGR